MELHSTATMIRCNCLIPILRSKKKGIVKVNTMVAGGGGVMSKFHSLVQVNMQRKTRLRARVVEEVNCGDGREKDKYSCEDEEEADIVLMNDEERSEFRRQIREVIDMNPNVEEEQDPIEKRRKADKFLAEYPLVVDEEDPDWPEDADGRGFNFDQFFDKISIKNVKKDEEDEKYDNDKELVWQDDDYIRPIRDITVDKWEDTVFKDISPLIIFVHNRYKRPKENEKVREELEKTAYIFWNSRMPSPRCVAVDAFVEKDLVSSLNVSVFPEIVFTKAGRILYREKVFRTAEELSKIMAFFYYGAAKPLFLNVPENQQELIPPAPRNDEESLNARNFR